MTALPKDSLVLVTGANGYIGSHIVDQALQAGFRVRGVVRNAEKSDWMETFFTSRYGERKFELAVVPDMAAKDAYSEVVKGCKAFIHVATDISFGTDPDVVIPTTVKGTQSALQAAASEPEMQHFVYTSSTAAAWNIELDKPAVVTMGSWNEECLELAYKEDPMKVLHVYSASKVLAEREVWKYAKEQKPQFTTNAVVPNFNSGPILKPDKQPGSSGGVIPNFYKSGWEGLGIFLGVPSQHYVDVRDDARLHIAPLLDSSINNERIFGVASVFTHNEILEIMKKQNPTHKFPAPSEDKRRDMFDASGPRKRAEEILRKVFKQDGFISLEDSVKANLAHVV